MNIAQFNKIIQTITNKNLSIRVNEGFNPENILIELGGEYYIHSENNERYASGFYFKVPKKIDNLVKSFVNQYSTKYKEQLDSYITKPFYNLSHHCKSPKMLLKEIENNFNDTDTQKTYFEHGFYATNYGIGIYRIFIFSSLMLNKMDNYLINKGVLFANELSEKELVLRYKTKLSYELNLSLLNGFKLK